MAGDGQDRCGGCSLAYNREDRCPRILVCGHTSCTHCLDALIQQGQRRCPSCDKLFFSYSTVLIPKNFEILRRLGESSKSSSSYSSPLRLKSSLSVDSSLARSSASRGRFSASSVLGSSKTEDSFEIGGETRPRSEGGEGGLYTASTGELLPPPPPSSAPPSLDETANDPQVLRPQVEGTSTSGVDEGSSGGNSGVSRLSKSSSVDETRGPYTTPSYAFPTIRTRLTTTNTTGRQTDNDASSTNSSISGKTELRSAQSVPHLSSSTVFKLPRLSSSLCTDGSSSASSSGYTSPFLKTSSSSSISGNTLKSLQSGSKKLSLDSSAQKEDKSPTFYPATDSVDSSGLSRSMQSLHKLESKLSVPSGGNKQDDVDPGVSKWKLETPTSLSRRRYADTTSRSHQDVTSRKIHNKDATTHIRGVGDASRQTERQNAAVPFSTRSSGTPTHVLRMCRTITSKTRPVADDEAEEATQTQHSNTSSSYQRSTSSSSFFSSSSSSFISSSSSSASSKDTHSLMESSQTGQDGTEAPRDIAMMGMREIGPETHPPDAPPSGGASDGHTHSYSQHSSLGSRGDADDASTGRPSRAGLGGKTIRVQRDEARDATRRSPPVSSPSEMEDQSKETRKLALSASLSARLGARTGFLPTAIDEENEEDTGSGQASAGEGDVPAVRDGKLYKHDRQSVQPSPPRASLAARISARAGYLSGGRSGGGSQASRDGVQAEDSTKIDQQRRAACTWTKRGAAAGEHHPASIGGEDKAAGAPPSYLSTPDEDDAGDEEDKEMSVPHAALPNNPRPSLREAGGAGTTKATRKGGEAGAEAGTDGKRLGSTGGVIPSSAESKGLAGAGETRQAYSMYRKPRDVLGFDATPAHELSQHSRSRRHRLIDSRAKEELSEPGGETQAASNQGVAITCRGTHEAQVGKPSGHHRLLNKDNVSDLDTGSRGDGDRRAKLTEKREETPPVFRSGIGTANAISDDADGSSGTSGGILGKEPEPAGPQPPSDLFPWKKKWRSVTERTSITPTRHTRGEPHNTSLNGDSKQLEQENTEPRSTRQDRSFVTQQPGAAAADKEDWHSSSRGSLGSLSIGRVSSFQDDTDGAETRNPQDAAKTDHTHEAPSGSLYTRERNGGIQAGESRDGGGRKDVRSASVLKGNKRMSAWLASLSGDDGKHSTQTPDAAHQTEAVARGAAEHNDHVEESTTGGVGEETQDINAHLHQARPRIRGTSTTPTEEDVAPPPAPSRTNLTYLLTRLQNTEVKRTSFADKDEDEDEVFYETSEDEEDVNTQQQTLFSSSSRKMSIKRTEISGTSTLSPSDSSHDLEETMDEPDSTTRRRNPRHDQDEHSQTARRQEQTEAQESNQDCTDAPNEDPEGGTAEYEPGVGLCASHGLMLHLYCEDCEEWVCDECLKVLHRPSPKGSCRVISAAEGVNQMKMNHESFLASRNNTLDYFRAELARIVDECDNSINLHGDNLRGLEERMEEELRLLRGIESMRSLAKEKLRQVNYWEEVLLENLSRIDESSSSSDVINAVRESSRDILQKAMKAVSLEAGAGLLLSPPN